MERLGKLALASAAVGLLLVASATASAQEGSGTRTIGPNVRLTLTVVDSDPGERPAERAYDFVAQDGGGPAKLLMGWRVPIPTAQGGQSDDGEPVTEYVYQNIGFTASLMVSLLDDGRIAIRGEVEASGARKGPQELRDSQGGDDLPIIGTLQQSLNVTVKEGKPLRLAEVPDPEGGRVHIEIVAEILD